MNTEPEKKKKFTILVWCESLKMVDVFYRECSEGDAQKKAQFEAGTDSPNWQVIEGHLRIRVVP